MMRVLLLSRYGRLGASSRLRSYQYLPYLAGQGVQVSVAALLDDAYLRGLYAGQVPLGRVLAAYWGRLAAMRGAAAFDLVWVEKEMLPWLPAWVEALALPGRVPLVVDYDDALFHRYDQHRQPVVRGLLGSKIDAVMARADLVIVGNDYLGERARQAGARRVEWLPTVVDASRYDAAQQEVDGPLTIGWIGSPSTAPLLRQVAPVLESLVRERGVRVVAVGANPDQLAGLPIQVWPWSEAGEAAAVRQFHIGIMPLPDAPFERGKCGYKLIQYMASGKPVVASPVGVNSVIVREGIEGFLADSGHAWQVALERLCADPGLRQRMGRAGRLRVEAEYSLQVAAPRLEALLRSVGDAHG